MMQTRFTPIPYRAKGKCRGCQGEVPKPRRTWCSDACVEEALIRSGRIDIIRPKVFRRDKGMCALCGLDTEQCTRIIRYVLDPLTQDRSMWGEKRYRIGRRANDTVAYALWQLQDSDAYQFVMKLWTGRTTPYHGKIPHLWEADHTIPVCEGGGGCGLDGYRTLCICCHKEVTKALRTRLAERNRASCDAVTRRERQQRLGALHV